MSLRSRTRSLASMPKRPRALKRVVRLDRVDPAQADRFLPGWYVCNGHEVVDVVGSQILHFLVRSCVLTGGFRKRQSFLERVWNYQHFLPLQTL